MEDDNRGPLLLDSDIRAALNKMKNKKAKGVDDIPAVLWKALGSKG